MALFEGLAGQLDAPIARSEGSIEQLRRLGPIAGPSLADALSILAELLAYRNAPTDAERAFALVRECWPVYRRQQFGAWFLEVAGLIQIRCGRPGTGARLLAYGQAREARAGQLSYPGRRRYCEGIESELRAEHGAARVDVWMAVGATLTEDEAAQLAIANV